MNEAFIIDAVRTPIGRFGGALAQVRPDDLAAHAISELVRRTGAPPDRIDDVYWGAANQAGEDNRNVARMAALLAGLPVDVPGATVNRLCGSGLEAVNCGYRQIRCEEADLIVAGGSESMTRAPFVMAKAATAWARAAEVHDTSLGWRFVNPRLEEAYGTHRMGETAEEVASEFDVTRSDQDAFALESHRRAVHARDQGRFDDEIVPVSVPQRKGNPVEVASDEPIRPDTSFEALGRLRPAFVSEGSVTAGNSAGINDGAAAVLLTSEAAVTEQGLEPMARIVASAVAGVEPRVMGIGPILAPRKVLKRAAISVDDLDLIELNEAFAAQSLACIRELGLDPGKVNVNGGAIALGHPLGCSGARILTTLVHELRRRGGRYGLATMCIGVGQGIATLIERV
ncbi:MAG: thiolase family protein [Actinomycetota bacterium]